MEFTQRRISFAECEFYQSEIRPGGPFRLEIADRLCRRHRYAISISNFSVKTVAPVQAVKIVRNSPGEFVITAFGCPRYEPGECGTFAQQEIGGLVLRVPFR